MRKPRNVEPGEPDDGKVLDFTTKPFALEKKCSATGDWKPGSYPCDKR